MVGLGWQLDLMILEVFSNLNDSVILCGDQRFARARTIWNISLSILHLQRAWGRLT